MRFFLLALFSYIFSLPANAVEVEYKLLTLNIPDNELKQIAVPNFPEASLMLEGKNWRMHLSDFIFEKNCADVSKIAEGVRCEKTYRIDLLNRMTMGDSKLTRLIFAPGGLTNYPQGLEKQVYTSYIVYSLLPKDNSRGDYPIVVVVDKKTGQTIDIQGDFTKKQLGWLNLELPGPQGQ